MLDIATISQSIAIISACLAIIFGIGAWKREFIGKRKIELAEEMLSTFFEVKDAIQFIRNPWSNDTEGRNRERSSNETDDEARLLDRGYIVYERYEAKKEIFFRFNVLKYKFMAMFGTATESLFQDTNKTLNSIFASANLLSTHYWQRQGRVPMEVDELMNDLNEMNKHQGVFWDSYNDEDEIRNT